MKTEEIIDRNIGSVDKVIKVLQFLNEGMEIELSTGTYKIGETNSGGFMLLQKMFTYVFNKKEFKPEEHETYWVGAPINLQQFSKLCNDLSDEEITILTANLALTKINRNERRND